MLILVIIAITVIAVFWVASTWLIGKSPDAGKKLKAEEEGSEDEMVGWHHWFNGAVLEQTPGDGKGQRNLAAAVHGVIELDTTWWLNNNHLIQNGKEESVLGMLGEKSQHDF